MSSPAEQEQEIKRERRHAKIGLLVDYGLEGALSRAGYTLIRLSFRSGAADYLLTLVLNQGDLALVAFIGAETMGGCVLKAARMASTGKLKTQPDKYRT